MTYTEIFAQLVTEITATVKKRKSADGLRFAFNGIGYDLADRTQRMTLIERVIDGYVKAHADVNQAVIDAWTAAGAKNERPSPISLDTALIERLTDAILDEEITDPNPYKVAHEEYPFFSDRQLELRRDRETGLKSAEETGTDGRNYRLPVRRRRSNYENNSVDKNAKIRNAERAASYKREITAGPVVTYNLRDNGGELTEPFVAARNAADTWRERLSFVN